MRALLRYTVLGTLVILAGTCVYARLTMFRGVPWQPIGGKGSITVEWGDRVHGIAMTLNGNGLSFERNPSEYSFAAPEPANWSVSYGAHPLWNWCGTGKDGYKVASERNAFCLCWKSGVWISWDDRVPPRPHCVLTIPHWLTSSAAAAWPSVAMVTTVVRRRRYPEGHCRACDYDLRATPERCPECGTPAVVHSSETPRGAQARTATTW